MTKKNIFISLKELTLVKFTKRSNFTGFTPHHYLEYFNFQNKDKHWFRKPFFGIFSFFKNGGGFTLTELIIIIFMLLLVTQAVYSSYLLSYRSYRTGEKMAEITQNGRVIIERMTREIRQAREIAGDLSNQEINAADAIKFEDGHIYESYHYIHYFKEDGEIKREVIGYYFSGDINTLVPWDAEPPFGQSTSTIIFESPKIIGEYVSSLGFWGSSLINIKLTLEKEDKKFNLKTKVFGRNL